MAGGKEQKTTVYYLVGCGKGDLAPSDWDVKNVSEHLIMSCQDAGNANIYSIALTLCEGDAFQICHDGAWDGQMGIGFMEGVAFCGGINPHDGCSYFPSDQMIAAVKDIRGNTVFLGYNEFYRSYKTWNVTVGKGMGGTYRFTYFSYPLTPSFDRILWERLS